MNRRDLILAGTSLAFLPHGAPAQTPVLPVPTGPHPVGRVIEDWVDQERDDPFAPDRPAKRTLPVVIWHPAAASTLPRAPYYPPWVSAAIRQQPNGETRLAQVSRAAATAGENAPLIASGALPVVLLKPALGAMALDYTSLAEDLASHGYLVAGSDSPYTTPLVAFRDGRVVPRSATGGPRGPAEPHPLAPGQPNGLFLPVVEVWADDERFILDRLNRLNAESGLFTGRLDLSRVAAIGHSFGGSTAMELAHRDPRVKAVVNIEGAPLGEVVRTGLAKPLLYIVSDGAPPASDADRALLAAVEAVRSKAPNRPSRAVVIARHFNFQDNAAYVDLEQSRRMGALGPVDPREALATTAALTRAFLDVHLKGRTGPFPPPGAAGVRLD